ncbi:MAG: CDP-glycerol glycerophosphotransferase family protein [Clostridium sp.]|nr:CDP-glycerol glycerophosphotransferase family protein [Clostridium sp.]
MKIKEYITKLYKMVISYLSFLSIRNKNKVIFGAWFGDKFLDNSKYLFKQMNKVDNIRNIWITSNENVYNRVKLQGYEVYMSSSIKGIYHQLTACKYFTCTGKDDVSSFLLSGAEHIELWHGIPLKKIMNDDKITNNDDNVKFAKKLFREIMAWPEKKFYKVISTSKEFSKIYTGAFAVKPMQILQLGQPRNDVFFDDSLEDEDFPKEYKEKKIILYMPTHRKEGKIKFDIENILNLKEINDLCENNNILFLIKKHYFHKNEVIDLSNYQNIIDITNLDFDSQMLLKYTDILISDYSSCYIDYLLLDRPIIFYNFDYDDYLKNDREMYFDYDLVTPGSKVNTCEELVKEIDNLLKNKDEYNEERNEVRNLFYDVNNQGIVSSKIIKELF